MARLERVFADTATLYPISVADLVLRLAEAGMFDLIWSDHLLDEVERVLVGSKGLSREAASYFCGCIRRAFPEGRVLPKPYSARGRRRWTISVKWHELEVKDRRRVSRAGREDGGWPCGKGPELPRAGASERQVGFA